MDNSPIPQYMYELTSTNKVAFLSTQTALESFLFDVFSKTVLAPPVKLDKPEIDRENCPDR